ncbi:hypothetical protein TRM7557_01487 [Tritonibacter multivorans]|uniref:DUF1330 domain-containing protein n=1 Tax=Tritonibacter multivorans TaxID=928856 RepID=A0A0P1G7Y8_9RHOB|nr:DUF1330 domain-containing protein [Tritonibacter multivorans]MDA7422364.1 DUF1330 domain-containing protein [Tritonibacter multivorans]CUH77682.1 hypothetical protein TRM7557_01487 [Tritonibacter multivorans]SFD14201.1 Uncharacterized conserved protein, DUF1330 family [Tritonibacter multivorans]
MVYAYGNIIVSAPEQLAAYREKAADALNRHQGRVVSASPKQTVIEGDFGETGIGVLLEFPTAQDAKNWITDPDLQSTHDLRRAAGQSNIVIIGEL